MKVGLVLVFGSKNLCFSYALRRTNRCTPRHRYSAKLGHGPGGVGVFQNKLLKDGDVVTTTIDGLGTITNKCVRASDHARADFLPEQMKPLLAGRRLLRRRLLRLLRRLPR